MTVRSEIETLLNARELAHFAEHSALRDNVEKIDRRFRALLRPDAELAGQSEWWRRGILRRAGEMYVAYMKEAHGIDVQLVEG